MGRGDGVKPASQSSIAISFNYKGRRCRERLKLAPTAANLLYVKRLKAQIENEITLGTFDYAKHFPDSPRARQVFEGEPLGPYLLRWLEAEKPNIKASTYRDYRKTFHNVLVPRLEGVTLQSFRLSHAKAIMRELDVSRKRISNILSPLRLALQDAVEDDLIPENPLEGFKVRKKKGVKPRGSEIDPLTAEERAAIFRAAKGEFANQVQFNIWTGLRSSEIMALRPEDIDWKRGVVRVSQAWTAAAEEPEEPKTLAGYREVRLLAPALDALQAQLQLIGDSPFLFRNPNTKQPWSGDKMIREHHWKPLLTRAGVRYRYPYQMRHTYASMMLQAGEHPMWVATQMGHTDWSFTVRTYSRFIPDDMPDAGQKAVDRWGAERFSKTTNRQRPKLKVVSDCF